MNEISFEVAGYPPLKGEALSVFNPRHGQSARIKDLLSAAQQACREQDFIPVEEGDLALVIVARSPKGDAANIIGGIADVLEDKPSKSYRSAIEHLGDLATVWLYRDDNQIKEIVYSEEAGEPGYLVALRELAHAIPDSSGAAVDAVAADPEAGLTYRHAGIVITLLGAECSSSVHLKASGFAHDALDEIGAGDGAKFISVRTRVLNDAMASIDLTCGYPIGNHLIDERGRRFDSIDALYRIPGNPECNDNLQPGFEAGMTWIYRLPTNATVSAFEFEDLTELTRDRTIPAVRIPLTIPMPC